MPGCLPWSKVWLLLLSLIRIVHSPSIHTHAHPLKFSLSLNKWNKQCPTLNQWRWCVLWVLEQDKIATIVQAAPLPSKVTLIITGRFVHAFYSLNIALSMKCIKWAYHSQVITVGFGLVHSNLYCSVHYQGSRFHRSCDCFHFRMVLNSP